MVCPGCNTVNPDDLRFCGQCGRALAPGADNTATVILDYPPVNAPQASRPIAATGILTTQAGATQAGATQAGTWGAGPQAFHLATGAVFANRYRIERLLGEGGMGAVYQALDLELDRMVALKLVRPELASPQAMQRFKQELLLASRISHKNILRIHDLSDFGGVKYITMAFVEGRDLADLIDRTGRLPLDRALKFARQLCAALEAAHGEDVVHRDLKPQNILVDQADNLFILDFGLAKSLEAEVTKMTRTGQIMGTPRYMSPEQVEAKEVDHRSDLYSLGLILYEMFTGQVPFRGESAMQLMYQRMTERPPDPRTKCPDLPEYIAAIILKCLAKDPDRRYRSARQILDDLEAQRPPAEESADGAPVATAPGVGGTAGGASASTPAVGPAATLADIPRAPSRPRDATISIQIPKPSRRTGVVAAVLVTLVAGLAAIPQTRRAILSLLPGAHSGPPAIQNYVAVLPLNVVGDEGALKYLADGVVESLSAKLGGLQNVFVADGARVASAVKQGDDEKIAKALGVAILIKGTIQQGASDHIAITLRMDDPQKHRQVMKPSEFDGVRQDLLTLEDNAFKSVADALTIHETNEERARTSARPTQDNQAYDLYLKGSNLLRQNDANADKAGALFDQAVKRDATFALAYAGSADADLILARTTNDGVWTERALGAAQQAVRLNDDLPEAHVSLGAVYTRTGKNEFAIAELQRALQLRPNSDDAHRRLGAAYEAAGNTTQAIAAYKEAIRINPYLWWNFNSLGRAYFNAGDNQQALEAIRQVTVLEPDSATGWANLGAAYYRLGDWDKWIESLQKARKLQPKAYYDSQLGAAYFFLGRYAESVGLFETAVQKEPKNASYRANLGDAYRWSGQRDKASAAYDQAIKLAYQNLDTNPNDTEALYYLASAYAKKGDDANGRRFIQQALKIKPADPGLLDLQAQVDAIAGRTKEALDSLKLALQNGSSFEEIRRDPEFKALRQTPEFAQLEATTAAEKKK
jgi:eukaryotic-like serine/threonine-protein kinase